MTAGAQNCTSSPISEDQKNNEEGIDIAPLPQRDVQ